MAQRSAVLTVWNGTGVVEPPAPPITDPYSDLVLSRSPIAYWKMYESSGNSLEDSSGNGFHLPAGVAAQDNVGVGDDFNWYDLTTTTNAFLLNNASPLGTSQISAGSMEMWCRFNSLTDGYLYIQSQPGFTQANFFVGMFSDGMLRVGQSPRTGNLLDSAAGVLTTGSWLHIVVTLGSAGALWTIYVNGASVGAGGPTGGFSGTPDQTVIGGESDQTNPRDADVRRVALYGAELSAAQVAAHYAEGIKLPSQV